MRRKIKMYIYIIIFIGILLVVLDFIPVKMAVNIRDSSNLKSYIKNDRQSLYICEYVQVTGSIWRVMGDENGVGEPLKSGSIYFYQPSEGKNPLKALNSGFVPYYTFNKFVFIGEEGKRFEEGIDVLLDFKVDDWKIVYPIRRNSLRDIYAPKSYLTIYDFIKI